MALFTTAVNCDLCATSRTVFVVVRLVHEHTVYAELLKGHHIIFPVFGPQFFEPRLQTFLRLFELLDGELFAALPLQLRDTLGDLVDLLLQETLLSLMGYGNLLELTVPDDNGIIVAGGDASAELLAIGGLEILLRGD